MRNFYKINNSGAALVEFALVAPILLLFLMSILEFGNIYIQKQTILLAARQGAYQLSTNSMSINQAEILVKDILRANGIKLKNVSIDINDSSPSCKDKNSFITVWIKIPFKDASITGDPFNLFKKYKYLDSKIKTFKACKI